MDKKAKKPHPLSIIGPASALSNRARHLVSRPVGAVLLTLCIAAGALLPVVASGKLNGAVRQVEPIGAGPGTFLRRRPWDEDIRSHVGFRLVVRDGATRRTIRVCRRPGRHQLVLAGTRVDVRIRRVPRANLARSDEGKGAQEVTFAGWRSARRFAFRTRDGPVCHVPEEAERVRWLLRSAHRGQKLLLHGTGRSDGHMRVRQLLYAPSTGRPARKAAWKVTMATDSESRRWFWKPGHYLVNLAGLSLSLQMEEVRKASLAIGGHELTASVADNARRRSRGLQGWHKLKDDEGMLFVFERRLRPSFLMKDVTFPLSIAFFRRDGTLVHIGRRSTGDQRPVKPPEPAKYVLEVNRGWFRERDLQTGTSMTFGAAPASRPAAAQR